jgi:hypothetical protein
MILLTTKIAHLRALPREHFRRSCALLAEKGGVESENVAIGCRSISEDEMWGKISIQEIDLQLLPHLILPTLY